MKKIKRMVAFISDIQKEIGKPKFKFEKQGVNVEFYLFSNGWI